MNRSTFAASPQVTAFTNCLAARLDSLSIDLDIKSSRFVPGGIRVGLSGLAALLPHYRWVTESSDRGDWPETREGLRNLGRLLRQAIDAGDEEAVLAACKAILAWGGDRNPRVGAFPYLSGLHEQKALARYLGTARRAFALDTAIIDARSPQASKMNSMLTKVHALASTDGLPIYDSRVAAAIAALVELWRRAQGLERDALPAELVFPPTTSDRSVLYLFDDAQAPECMSYAAAVARETAASWSSAKIRLGWLMRETLSKSPGLFAGEADQDRMHAFEACLFMVGYDVACLRGNWPGTGLDKTKRARLQRAGRDRLRREQAGLAHRTISTLAREDGRLAYAGTVDTGISGRWGESTFAFDSDFLQGLLADFPPGTDAGLGASMTGEVKPDTIGFWIDEHYPAKPRRYASALAAIFVDQGLARRVDGTGPVRLRFV